MARYAIVRVNSSTTIDYYCHQHHLSNEHMYISGLIVSLTLCNSLYTCQGSAGSIVPPTYLGALPNVVYIKMVYCITEMLALCVRRCAIQCIHVCVCILKCECVLVTGVGVY